MKATNVFKLLPVKRSHFGPSASHQTTTSAAGATRTTATRTRTTATNTHKKTHKDNDNDGDRYTTAAYDTEYFACFLNHFSNSNNYSNSRNINCDLSSENDYPKRSKFQHAVKIHVLW